MTKLELAATYFVIVNLGRIILQIVRFLFYTEKGLTSKADQSHLWQISAHLNAQELSDY